MSDLYIDENGKIRSAVKSEFADKIMELKEKGDPWAVVEELVKYWVKSSPEEVTAVKLDVQDRREMLVDKEYGTTLHGGAMERRFKLLFPTTLMLLIRSVYPHSELRMDKEFYDEFATRYPGFRVAEKA